MHGLRTYLAKRSRLLIIVILSVALGAGLAGVFPRHDGAAYAIDQKTAVDQQRAVLRDLQTGFTSIAEETLPSVVRITSKEKPNPSPNERNGGDDFFRQFPFPFPMPEMPDSPGIPRESSGTGVIVRSDGYIITNAHVVGGADTVTVKLKNGSEYRGKVFSDPKSDLALVKIDAGDLTAAKLGDSDKIKVGQWAIAIGSPFGLDQTVTVGVVSGIGRKEAVEDKFYPNLIQTDASINPGNSGGPLVNIDGEVIGINTLIRSSFGGNIGIGFAIPVNTAKFVLEQLIEHGKVTRGFLGIIPVDLTPKDAELYGVEEGAFVQSVEVGAPADQAGMQVEDVIVEFGGKKVRNEIDLREITASTPPGTEVSVVVIRDRKRVPLTVRLVEAGDTVATAPKKETVNKLGFSVANLTPELAEKFKLKPNETGVAVTGVAPGSPAMRHGLSVGMLIYRINDKPVTNVADFESAVKDQKPGDTLRILFKTSERTGMLKIPID